MIRKILLASLLVAAPAFGAGDASEQRCDNPGPGVVCTCSEPFTANEQVTKTTNFNPASSTTRECNNGTSVSLSGATATSIEDGLADGGTTPITVGGSGYVLEVSSSGTTQVNDGPSVNFTDGTYCTRRYIRWDGEFSCNGATTCNFKGPRYESKVSQLSTLGFESSGGNAEYTAVIRGSPGGYWQQDDDHGYQPSNPSQFGCGAANSNYGCDGQSRQRAQNPNGLTFEGMQDAWFRWEICFDHNPTASQIAAANVKYGTSVVYEESDRVYTRQRMVMVTNSASGGGLAGQQIIHGPTLTHSAVPSIQTGEIMRHFSTRVGSRCEGGAEPCEINGKAWIAYVMATKKEVVDPTYWIGAALEVPEDAGGIEPTPTAAPGGPTPTPTTEPTATPTPTPTATPTTAPTATPTALPGTNQQEQGCPGSTNPNPKWIFCDNFDDALTTGNPTGNPITDKWNLGQQASFEPVDNIGLDNSIGMQASWITGQVAAGGISIALGDLPGEYEPGVTGTGGPEEDWSNILNPAVEYDELYTRQYLKMGTGWTGVPRKFHRFRILSDYKTGDTKNASCTTGGSPYSCCIGNGVGNCLLDVDHPTAYQGHFWQQINTNQSGTIGALYFNSSNGVNANGLVIDEGNSTDTAVFITQVRGSRVIWQDYPAGSEWFCIEAHVKLNTPGSSDGIEEFWINGELDASNSTQDMRGIYTQYGLNQVVFDNYWNGGAPTNVELYRDNIVIATERIGCLDTAVVPAPKKTTGVLFGAGLYKN